MKVDTSKWLMFGLLGALSLVLSGCGNKGDLELVRKPVAVNLPSPVSVPEEQTSNPESKVEVVEPDGVVLDISQIAGDEKKKKSVGE